MNHILLLDDKVHVISEWEWDEEGSQPSENDDGEGHSAMSDHLNKYLVCSIKKKIKFLVSMVVVIAFLFYK